MAVTQRPGRAGGPAVPPGVSTWLESVSGQSECCSAARLSLPCSSRQSLGCWSGVVRHVQAISEPTRALPAPGDERAAGGGLTGVAAWRLLLACPEADNVQAQ